MLCRAYSRNACPFHILGPKGCPGIHAASPVKGSPVPTAARNTRNDKATAASGKGEASSDPKAPGTGAAGSKSPRPPSASSARGSPAASVSSTTRMFLSTARGNPVGPETSSPRGEAGVGSSSPAAQPHDWWDHIGRVHLRDCVATVGGIIGRSGEAAGAAADALSPRVLCDVPGCSVHFSVTKTVFEIQTSPISI